MRPPGFLAQLFLLWGLRVRIGLNKGQRPSRALAVLSFALSSLPGVFLGLGFYRLMVWDPVRTSPVWSAFVLNLLSFVTSSVWVAWPVLSAGVDDHSELSRYSAFPISPFRLMFASTLSSLFEPRAVVFYAPLIGATAGYLHHRLWALVPLLPVFACYAVLNAAWSRVGLHLVLNVLRQQRSAEIIGGGFALTLVACSFIPPIDASWLKDVGVAGVAALNLKVILDAALALSRVPPGFFGDAVWAVAHGRSDIALLDASLIVVFTAMGLRIAYALLLRFHHDIGRAGPPLREAAKAKDVFASAQSRFSALLIRERLDLWRNPRARLLASVPFLLAILLKLLSGRVLFEYFLGRSADAWVLGGLSLYGAVVIASTFAQNTFAYDGQGFALFLAAPLPLGDVLKAKNRIHAIAAVLLGFAVCVFYTAYFQSGGLAECALAMAAIFAMLPVLLTAGNFLSVFFPVKFHASMKRRDKLPFTASMLGVAAASVGAWPFVFFLRRRAHAGVDGATLLSIAGVGLLAWGLYFALRPCGIALLQQRREIILRAVTRD